MRRDISKPEGTQGDKRENYRLKKLYKTSTIRECTKHSKTPHKA